MCPWMPWACSLDEQGTPVCFSPRWGTQSPAVAASPFFSLVPSLTCTTSLLGPRHAQGQEPCPGAAAFSAHLPTRAPPSICIYSARKSLSRGASLLPV